MVEGSADSRRLIANETCNLQLQTSKIHFVYEQADETKPCG